MLEKPAKIGENRLKKVLINDKMEFSSELKKILLSDITRVLDNYLEVDEDSIGLIVNIQSDNTYTMSLTASIRHIKSYGIVI